MHTLRKGFNDSLPIISIILYQFRLYSVLEIHQPLW